MANRYISSGTRVTKHHTSRLALIDRKAEGPVKSLGLPENLQQAVTITVQETPVIKINLNQLRSPRQCLQPRMHDEIQHEGSERVPLRKNAPGPGGMNRDVGRMVFIPHVSLQTMPQVQDVIKHTGTTKGPNKLTQRSKLHRVKALLRIKERSRKRRPPEDEPQTNGTQSARC